MTQLPPGPRVPGIWQTAHAVVAPLEFMKSVTEKYGDTITLRFPGMFKVPMVSFSRPEHIEEVFKAPADEVDATMSNEVLRPFLGDKSMLLLEGERHRRERRLMMPAFHGERMRAYARIIGRMTDAEIDKLPTGRAFPIISVMQRITMEVILRAIFGLNEGERLEHLRHSLSKGIEIGNTPWLLVSLFQRDWGRWTRWGRFKDYQRQSDAIVLEQVERCRKEGSEGRTDILALLVDARDEDGQPMSDDELRDEMRTLLVAGHETTATSLGWACAHILGDEQVLAKLRAEIEEVVGDGPIEAEHVAQMPYLDAAIRETMRLNPVAPAIGRRLRVPRRIGEYDLPADIIVSLTGYLTHRLPDIYPEPERFRPERFIERKPGPFEWLPFGGGRRRCIGMAFALFEMKLVLAQLLRRTELRRAPKASLKAERRGVTVGPKGGMPVIVDRVFPAPAA